MSDVEIRKPTAAEIREASSWPTWEKEVSAFPWTYDERETCYLLAGRVTVFAGGRHYEFGAGDLVVFRKGLECHWEITEAVRKHYSFG